MYPRLVNSLVKNKKGKRVGKIDLVQIDNPVYVAKIFSCGDITKNIISSNMTSDKNNLLYLYIQNPYE